MIAAVTGVFSNEVSAYPDVTTSYGETIQLYQIGLYARDSVSMAAQAIAQDYITLILGIPLCVVSLYLVQRKGSMRGWFLLTGTLAYFLYTYASYSFLMTFNRLYVVYVLLFVASFYAFLLSLGYLKEFDTGEVFSGKYPVKALSIFLGVLGVVLCFMWMGRIVPAMLSGGAPYGLEQYSTLVIQSLDLGVVVPASFVAAYLLYRRKKWGYLLSAVLVMKALTMTAAVSAMGFNMKLHGVEMPLSDLIVFPVFVVINVVFLVKIVKGINPVKTF